jgi:hypothetical protein
MDKTALYARDASGLEWHKSEKSNMHDELECVLVAKFPDGAVAVRDSNDPSGARELRFTAREWAAFTAAVSEEQSDLT